MFYVGNRWGFISDLHVISCGLLIYYDARRACDLSFGLCEEFPTEIPQFYEIFVGNELAWFWLDVCPRHPGVMWARPETPFAVRVRLDEPVHMT